MNTPLVAVKRVAVWNACIIYFSILWHAPHIWHMHGVELSESIANGEHAWSGYSELERLLQVEYSVGILRQGLLLNTLSKTSSVSSGGGSGELLSSRSLYAHHLHTLNSATAALIYRPPLP